MHTDDLNRKQIAVLIAAGTVVGVLMWALGIFLALAFQPI